MRRSGVKDYVSFARQALQVVTQKPISFEVFSDDFDEMEQQAFEIASWAENVYVKIPITNTQGHAAVRLIRDLSSRGIKVNVTAVMTLRQVRIAAEAIGSGSPSIISVFAGRIADTGRDPVPLMSAAVALLSDLPNVQLLWASPRELLNIVQADQVGCDIVTVTNDLLSKLQLIGKDLDRLSLETVKMFHSDALEAGYSL